MAKRPRRRLNDLTVQRLSEEGRYADGGGLYLSVDKSGARRWLFIFRWKGKRPEMGLGGFPVVKLAEARRAAEEAERQVRSGINPLDERRAVVARKAQERSFGEVADEAVPILTQGHRNRVHVRQWASTLSDAYIPHLRSLRISEIEVADVAQDLAPLWRTKGETAKRLRGRIEKVLDYAEGRGLRSGSNPARLSPVLQALLGGDPQRIGGHHSAMPYADVAQFMARLKERDAVSADAYQFLILTAARVSETVGARWSEINWTDQTWTIPAERYKTKRDCTIPLSSAAQAVLAKRQAQQHQLALTTDYIFTRERGIKLSTGVFAALQKRMGETSFTAHGFRSAFRDWGGDETEFERETLEQALGHEIGNRVEQAYRRMKALEKRRVVMTAWARFVSGQQMKRPQRLVNTDVSEVDADAFWTIWLASS